MQINTYNIDLPCVLTYIINQNRVFMNKKIFYSLVLMVMAAFMPAVAQETLTVYEGQGQSNVVPAYIFYWDDFTRSQVVFPAEQLNAMNGGQITALTFYTDQTAEYVTASTADVYLMEVDYTTMTAFEPKGDVLYSGTFTVNADGTITLELATPYQYGGGNLLLGIENTTDAGYKNVKFYGQTGNTGASFAGYNSGSTDAVTGSARDFIPKTTFTYTPGGGVIVPKPTALTIADVTTNSANISWTAGGEETSWNFEYKKKADEEWTSQVVTTPSVALDALTNGCEYNVRVNAIAGENTSVWVTGNFVTPTCEDADKGEISYELTDSYGDGWNGNALEFYNSNGVLEATVTITTGGKDAPVTGTVALCYGETYTIKWKSGSYGSECGFVIYGPGGDELVNHAQGTAPTAGQEFVTFLMEMPTCFTPKDLTVGTVTYNTAALSWTPGSEDQDAWQVAVGAAGFNPDQENYVYTDVTGEPNVTIENLTEGTKYDAYVRGNCGEGDVSAWSKVASFETPLQFPLPTELAVSDITAKSAVATWLGNCPAFNLRYREKTNLDESFEAEEAPAGWTTNNWLYFHIIDWNLGGTVLAAADGESCYGSKSMDDSGSSLTPLGVDNWLISSKANLGGTLEFYVGDLGPNYVENFSVYVSTTGTAVDDFTPIAENIATPGTMISSASAWEKKEFDLSDYEGQQGYIAIRHHDAQGYYLFVDAMKIAGENVPEAEWVTIENTTAPVTMQPLQPSTTYECQVQGIYEDGISGWTESVNFTTLPSDALPTNLFVNNITATTADANWEGSQDAYNLRYRTAGIYPGYEEGFEYGLASGEFPTESGWITIDADGDGYAWYTFTPDDNTNQYVYDASCMTSASYMGGALTPDDWLISPALDLGGTLSFMVRGQDPSYAAEHYAVYVSTGERTDLTSYVELIPESVSGAAYEEVTADLSDYEGQTGYIAIRHFNCTDMFRLNIDNFKIIQAGDVVEPGEWQVVENVNSIYTIEGLTPETKYEVQVQGIVDEQNTTEWTASTFFTTLAEEETGFNEFYLVGDFNNWGDGVEPLKFEEVEDGVFEAKVDLPAGNEFKVITYGDDDQAIWMGGTDETGVGYYLITNELLNVPTTLWVGAGSNFRMQEAAVYIVRITEAQTTGLKGISAPLQIEFIYYAPTGIYDINADKGQSNEWYNLNGQKLNGKPVVPGIYINGGKKVIVK